MRALLVTLTLVLIALPVAAQDATGTITNTGDVVSVIVVNTPSQTVQLSGTWVGVVVFEYTLDGATWNPLTVAVIGTNELARATAANGAYLVANPGYVAVRVRATAMQSGSALVSMTRGFVIGTLPSGAFCNPLLHAAAKC